MTLQKDLEDVLEYLGFKKGAVKVFSALYLRGPMSHRQIEEATGMAYSFTVSSLKALRREKLVRVYDRKEKRLGRPLKVYEIDDAWIEALLRMIKYKKEELSRNLQAIDQLLELFR